MAGYNPAAKNLSEARLVGIENTLVAGLADLNTALLVGGLWPAGFPITAAMVRRGDVAFLPKKEVAPILFCVCMSDDDLNLKKTDVGLAPTMGYVAHFETEIFAYLHPEAMPAADYVTGREDVIARVIDWVVYGVFNRLKADGTNGLQIPLPSNVFISAPGSDYLDGAIESAKADWFVKDYGGSERVRGAHFIHRGFVG